MDLAVINDNIRIFQRSEQIITKFAGGLNQDTACAKIIQMASGNQNVSGIRNLYALISKLADFAVCNLNIFNTIQRHTMAKSGLQLNAFKTNVMCAFSECNHGFLKCA